MNVHPVLRILLAALATFMVCWVLSIFKGCAWPPPPDHVYVEVGDRDGDYWIPNHYSKSETAQAAIRWAVFEFECSRVRLMTVERRWVHRVKRRVYVLDVCHSRKELAFLHRRTNGVWDFVDITEDYRVRGKWYQ